MKIDHAPTLCEALCSVTSILILGISMNAFGLGRLASWNEEVLLHDGTKVIVERSQTRGGRHEIGQEEPLAEHTVSFQLPGIEKPVTWKSEYGMEIEKASLQLLALDVVGGVPYIVTTTAGCIAYNKWSRPNPPYVFFKFDGKDWQRIPLAEFPAAIREANVGISTQRFEPQLIKHSAAVPAIEVRKMNADAKNPDVLYLRFFVREPIKVAQTVACEELVYYKGAWIGPGNSIGRRLMDRIAK